MGLCSELCHKHKYQTEDETNSVENTSPVGHVQFQTFIQKMTQGAWGSRLQLANDVIFNTIED